MCGSCTVGNLALAHQSGVLQRPDRRDVAKETHMA